MIRMCSVNFFEPGACQLPSSDFHAYCRGMKNYEHYDPTQGLGFRDFRCLV